MSNGPAPVQIPDTANMSYDEAAQALAAKGFAVTAQRRLQRHRARRQGDRHQSAAERRKRAGRRCTISVSKGPELVTVPDLTGNTLEVAQQKLVALGLDVDTVGYLPGRVVRSQSVAANQMVKKATKVTLTF